MSGDMSQNQYKEMLSKEVIMTTLANVCDHVYLKACLSVCALGFNWLFETRRQAVMVVALLLLLDTITGAMKAYHEHELSSGGFFRCATKCTVYFILMATASLVDKAMPISFASSVMVTFLAATEALSVMENLARLGFPVPSFLVNRLMTIKSTAGDSKPVSDDKKP
jgi:toxin secretion/phage lysis holin